MKWGWYDLILIPLLIVVLSFIRVTLVKMRPRHEETPDSQTKTVS